jgi:alkanesulfonate monooxygenase SsuD/methylene tetrahydromethanopterin reductase-like flavin-dependent oxidoreductase (luciferase family)
VHIEGDDRLQAGRKRYLDFVTSIGALVLPQLPPQRLRDVALVAEDAGLEQLWLSEDCFLTSGVAAVAAVLAWTERLRVGIGVLPAPLRNVALASMEFATLHRLFPGRLIPGLGHGVQDWMAQAGARVDSPMTLLREYLLAMRALLRGERVSVDGRYVKLDGVALDWPPLTPTTLFLGAVGPRTLRLSGELADGTLLDASPEEVRQAHRFIDDGRAAGGRIDHHELGVYHRVTLGPDAAVRTAQAVTALVDAGADTVILIPPPSGGPDPEDFVRFAANEIRALTPPDQTAGEAGDGADGVG